MTQPQQFSEEVLFTIAEKRFFHNDVIVLVHIPKKPKSEYMLASSGVHGNNR